MDVTLTKNGKLSLELRPVDRIEEAFVMAIADAVLNGHAGKLTKTSDGSLRLEVENGTDPR
jgi:hypothetical protein